MTKGKYMFDYREPPMVGHRKKYFKGQMLTLVAVDPYKRRDGTHAFVLTWKADDGRVGTSGMRSAAITWVRS